MGDGFQYLDIVLFAVIAGFLILRLRSVLGRRTGNERPRDPFVPPKPEGATENTVSLSRGRPSVGAPPANASAPPATPGARLKAADPGFDETAFLAGARSAFEIIVNAFAKGDTAALQPLLSDGVYASFAEAIRARLARHETFETNLLTIKTVELVDGEIEGDAAFATVKFVSDQTNVTRAADGSVVDGDPDRVVDKTDLWTFSRALRSRDPNWTLVATHSS
ncbi:MAG TPA: Tim44/TimA family putative adaptor protein [Stellaceae bacterium]